MISTSCLYEGRVRHRRYSPRPHSFEYSLFMVYLDLSELDHVFRKRWFWSCDSSWGIARFRREDHYGDPDQPLDESIRTLVQLRTGFRPEGPIRLLTHLRYLGYCFNPVSFFYCFRPDADALETIVAEIDNTPWGERHLYVLPVAQTESRRKRCLRFRFDKEFHVSPFMQMDLDYDWRFLPPGKRLLVHMENLESGRRLFDATLLLRRKRISSRSLARVLVRYPVMTAQVITNIYFQAFRLWLKRIPFHEHPGSLRSGRPSPVSLRDPDPSSGGPFE